MLDSQGSVLVPYSPFWVPAPLPPSMGLVQYVIGPSSVECIWGHGAKPGQAVCWKGLGLGWGTQVPSRAPALNCPAQPHCCCPEISSPAVQRVRVLTCIRHVLLQQSRRRQDHRCAQSQAMAARLQTLTTQTVLDRRQGLVSRIERSPELRAAHSFRSQLLRRAWGQPRGILRNPHRPLPSSSSSSCHPCSFSALSAISTPACTSYSCAVCGPSGCSIGSP